LNEHVQEAATAAASSPGLRATVGGGVAMISGGASHWVEWINSGISILLSVVGMCAVLYGVLRQREQAKLERERAVLHREEAARARELHALKVEGLRRRQNIDTDPAPL
jgi:predicted nucleic acid-binding protein